MRLLPNKIRILQGRRSRAGAPPGSRFRLPHELLSGLAVIAGIVAVTSAVFSSLHLRFDLLSLICTAILACLSVFLYHYLRERRVRLSIQEMFAHYVPDQVVRELIASPERLKLGGQRCRLTVLFADLEGFTSISEKLSAEQVVMHLNEYLTAMTEIILSCGGIIDKYEGDLIMAEFGAPVSCPDHAAQACRAALRMQAGLEALRSKWKAEGKPLLHARIGVSTGEVIVGNMGSRHVFDYTAVGDAVNLCARLEEANKRFGTNILISVATQCELPATFVTRSLGEVHIRGRSEPAAIFELIGEELPDRKRAFSFSDHETITS